MESRVTNARAPIRNYPLTPYVLRLDLLKQLLGKLFRFKREQIVHRLADADELDRDLKMVVDADKRTAAGRAIELGENQTCDACMFDELLGLPDRVLAGVGIKDQKHFVRLAVQRLFGNTGDLLQLGHQVRFAVLPACGVGQNILNASRLSSRYGIKDDRAGITAGLALDDFALQASRPDFKLFYCGCPKSIACCKQDRLTLFLQVVGYFRNGRSLADAIYADK